MRHRAAAAPLVLLSLLVGACAAPVAESQSFTTPEAESSTVAPTTSVTPVSTSTTTVTSSTTSSTTTAAPTTTTPDPHRTVVATARTTLGALVAYDAPNGSPLALPFVVPNPHQFGGPLTLMVTEGEIGDEWVKVQLPVRPNGTEGWIPTSDYALGETFVRTEVDLTERTVRVFDGDHLVLEVRAAIGTADTPTPEGTFYLSAKRRNPPAERHLGEWALVMSSFSEVLESFSGGLPVIAIHGTHFPERELGSAISNGCVRVADSIVSELAEIVPMGSPVIVST